MSMTRLSHEWVGGWMGGKKWVGVAYGSPEESILVVDHIWTPMEAFICTKKLQCSTNGSRVAWWLKITSHDQWVHSCLSALEQANENPYLLQWLTLCSEPSDVYVFFIAVRKEKLPHTVYNMTRGVIKQPNPQKIYLKGRQHHKKNKWLHQI